jgi:hypothetical protein
MRKDRVFLITGVLVFLLLASCGEVNPPAQNFEGIPGPEFNIPDPLVPQVSRAGDTSNVFEPFRASLYFAQECVSLVDAIIETLNLYQIPDDGQFISDTNELIVISTDENRDYATMIEVYTGTEANPGEKYMQISYTKGSDCGETVFDVDLKEPGSDVDRIKISYDNTGANPLLTGWLTFNYNDSDPYVTYPFSLYFNGVKENDIVTIEGGVSYHYFFDNEEGAYSDTTTYVYEHVYMFKTMSDTVAERAIVHLYFPLKEITLSSIEDWEISESMLSVLFDWLNMTGNSQLKTDLINFYGYDETKSGLYSLLDTHRGDEDLVDLIFILDLDNPIAYNSTGYVTNGTENVTLEYTGIGDIGSVTFSEEPLDIINMAILF